jgi:hypothetical protein
MAIQVGDLDVAAIKRDASRTVCLGCLHKFWDRQITVEHQQTWKRVFDASPGSSLVEIPSRRPTAQRASSPDRIRCSNFANRYIRALTTAKKIDKRPGNVGS